MARLRETAPRHGYIVTPGHSYRAMCLSLECHDLGMNGQASLARAKQSPRNVEAWGNAYSPGVAGVSGVRLQNPDFDRQWRNVVEIAVTKRRCLLKMHFLEQRSEEGRMDLSSFPARPRRRLCSGVTCQAAVMPSLKSKLPWLSPPDRDLP